MAFKKTFILSTEDVNSYGFRVLTEGIKLDNANKNLPCFYDHKTWEVPLGHWENLRKENGKLLGDLIINGDNEREKNYIKKIENGDIKGASVGADTIEWSESPLLLMQGQTRPTLVVCDLFEASITPLPGNTNSLALKHSGSLIALNNDNSNFLPSLQNTPNMKRIALKLGLAENATEDQIIDALAVVQLSAKSTEAMRKHVEELGTAEIESDAAKTLFVELTKTNFDQAVSFLKLSRKPAAVITTPAETKSVKITELIRTGSNNQKATEEGKDTYDYLQKHNPVELSRLRKEENEKYLQLAKDYSNGVRYKS